MKISTLVLSSALLAVLFSTSCKKLGQLPGHGKPPVIVDSLKRDLLLYLPFSGNTNDGSGNNLNGAGHSLAQIADRFGKGNSAYGFNGVDSYVIVPDVPALRLSNTDFTLNIWVKLNQYGSSFGYNLFSKHIPGINNGWVLGITGTAATITTTPGLISFGPGGGSPTGLSTSAIDLNKWHMITAVYTVANQTISIYIDGVVNSTTHGIPTPNPVIDASLFIGRDTEGASPNGYFVNGSLDEPRIYVRALSQHDINRLYTLNN